MSGSHFHADYNDGITGRKYSVRLTFYSQSMTGIDSDEGHELFRWPLNTLSFDDSYGELVRVSSSDYPDAAIMVKDPAIINALAQSGRIPKIRSKIPMFIGLFIITALCLGLIWVNLNPLTRYLTKHVPFSWEKKISSEFLAHQKGKDCSTTEVDAVVKKLLQRLKGSKKYPMDFNIRIVKSPVPNAFALPGGQIIINSALLQEAESADEVAGVLAHEMQHVIKRHITQAILRGAILSAIWQIMVGDFTGFLVVDPSTAYHIATLKFSREAEAEADRLAVQMLDRASISRGGFAKFFARNNSHAQIDFLEFLSSHPNADKRQKGILQGSPASELLTPALTKDDWLTLKSACPASSKGKP